METTRDGWLTRQMERRQITVRQLADALDVATQTVYNWQSGKSVINEERVPQLAAALDLSVVETRRGLGFWVQGEQDPPAETVSIDELKALREMLQKALDRIEEIQRGR